jgi:ATP-binding cassette subfamily B protein
MGKFGAPSLITRTTNDVQQVQMVVLTGTTMVLAAPIMCIGGIVMALREDLELSRLVLVCVPVLAGSTGFFIMRIIPKYRAMQPKLDTVNRVLREQINGMRVVRAFVRESAERERFESANAELTTIAIQIGKLQALIGPIVMLVFNASTVAVLWFGSRRVADDSLQVGALAAYIGYLGQILSGVMIATLGVTMIPRAAVSAERIGAVLVTLPGITAPEHAVVPGDLSGTVELRGIACHYPGASVPVLADISFMARPGTITAITGSTGAGKTTLLELIPRLSDPSSGRVLVDGVDVRDRELAVLRTRIGMVPQRAYLFSGTVASNLRVGNPDAADDQLWHALELAQAKDFVASMPGGLHSPIARGGTNVSGGQRQRLAIARALLRDPTVFLFDDAFSALDVATEQRLRAAIAPRLARATVIVVAHRIASIRHADQILVLDAGKLVGAGSHEQLVRDCPTYAEIVALQTEEAVA